MSGGRKKKKKLSKTVFESVRKPTAPPTRTMGGSKPDPAADPVGRKAKHKRKDDEDGDI